MRGSVTTIIKPDGARVKDYTYDEFGNLEEGGTQGFLNETTYTGSVKDESTGLQYMNARYYNPESGRFLSQDTYSGSAYEPWTQHLYSYCGNNPTSMVDPTGHFAFLVVIGIGLLLGGAGAVVTDAVDDGQVNGSIGVGGYAGGFLFGAIAAPIAAVAAPAFAAGSIGAAAAATGAAVSAGALASGVSQKINTGKIDTAQMWSDGFKAGAWMAGSFAASSLFLKPAIQENTSWNSGGAGKTTVKAENPLANIKYTDKVKAQMAKGDYHSFPDSVDAFGAYGKVTKLTGGDSVLRTKVEIPGSYQGVQGAFEYIIEPDGVTCNHRLFKPAF